VARVGGLLRKISTYEDLYSRLPSKYEGQP